MHGRQAFSLVELMVAVSILGVLVVLAWPRYDAFMVKARRGEAKSNLAHLYSLQKAYKVEYFSYYSGAPMTGSKGIGYRDGAGRTGDHACHTDRERDKGLCNHLGFKPEAVNELRYFYQFSGNDALASAASDADNRWVYPDCNGAGRLECGYGQGDAVKLVLATGKQTVCRNITKYCSRGAGHVIVPPITPTPITSTPVCTPSTVTSPWTPDPSSSLSCVEVTQTNTTTTINPNCSTTTRGSSQTVCGTLAVVCNTDCTWSATSYGTCARNTSQSDPDAADYCQEQGTQNSSNCLCATGQGSCPAVTCPASRAVAPRDCVGCGSCDPTRKCCYTPAGGNIREVAIKPPSCTGSWYGTATDANGAGCCRCAPGTQCCFNNTPIAKPSSCAAGDWHGTATDATGTGCCRCHSDSCTPWSPALSSIKTCQEATCTKTVYDTSTPLTCTSSTRPEKTCGMQTVDCDTDCTWTPGSWGTCTPTAADPNVCEQVRTLTSSACPCTSGTTLCPAVSCPASKTGTQSCTCPTCNSTNRGSYCCHSSGNVIPSSGTCDSSRTLHWTALGGCECRGNLPEPCTATNRSTEYCCTGTPPAVTRDTTSTTCTRPTLAADSTCQCCDPVNQCCYNNAPIAKPPSCTGYWYGTATDASGAGCCHCSSSQCCNTATSPAVAFPFPPSLSGTCKATEWEGTCSGSNCGTAHSGCCKSVCNRDTKDNFCCDPDVVVPKTGTSCPASDYAVKPQGSGCGCCTNFPPTSSPNYKTKDPPICWECGEDLACSNAMGTWRRITSLTLGVRNEGVLGRIVNGMDNVINNASILLGLGGTTGSCTHRTDTDKRWVFDAAACTGSFVTQTKCVAGTTSAGNVGEYVDQVLTAARTTCTTTDGGLWQPPEDTATAHEKICYCAPKCVSSDDSVGTNDFVGLSPGSARVICENSESGKVTFTANAVTGKRKGRSCECACKSCADLQTCTYGTETPVRNTCTTTSKCDCVCPNYELSRCYLTPIGLGDVVTALRSTSIDSRCQNTALHNVGHQNCPHTLSETDADNAQAIWSTFRGLDNSCKSQVRGVLRSDSPFKGSRLDFTKDHLYFATGCCSICSCVCPTVPCNC